MNESFKTTIGGQALIEGVMMKGPSKSAYAVRKPSGEIEIRVEKNKSILDRIPLFRLPILRGTIKLIEAMLTGVDAILYSASFWEEDDEESFLKKKFPNQYKKIESVFSVGISLFMAVLFFMILPNLFASFFDNRIQNHFMLNLIEGITRLTSYPKPAIKGKISRRINILPTKDGQPKNDNTITEMIKTINKKLVPHLGCSLECFFTSSTVRAAPAS